MECCPLVSLPHSGQHSPFSLVMNHTLTLGKHFPDDINSSLVIGLFGLVGILGVCTAPLIGRYVDRLIPWTGVLIGICIQMSGQVIVTSAGTISVAAVVIAIFLLDIGQQMQQVSNQMRVFAISDLARARLNADYIIFLFIGNFTFRIG
jgi:predicted MFS family arabinose efflux permease